MAADRNTCVKQQINFLPSGCYKLSIEYSARKGFPLTTGQFSISMNNNLLKNITSTSYALQTETIDIQIRNACGAELRLCGIGNDGQT